MRILFLVLTLATFSSSFQSSSAFAGTEVVYGGRAIPVDVFANPAYVSHLDRGFGFEVLGLQLTKVASAYVIVPSTGCSMDEYCGDSRKDLDLIDVVQVTVRYEMKTSVISNEERQWGEKKINLPLDLFSAQELSDLKSKNRVGSSKNQKLASQLVEVQVEIFEHEIEVDDSQLSKYCGVDYEYYYRNEGCKEEIVTKKMKVISQKLKVNKK